jgi:Ca2+-binding EF-hand superfamily protein
MGHMGMMGFGPVAHEMLKTVDTNNDGALSQDEITAAVNSRFSEFDADKNGSLSLPEFEALWAEITKPMAVRTFQFLDPNGDASVSKAELDDRFDKVVSRFDQNGDGVLSPADHRGPGGHGWRHHGWWNQGPAPQDGGPQDGGPDDQ